MVELLAGKEGFVGDFDFVKEFLDELFSKYLLSNLGLIKNENVNFGNDFKDLIFAMFLSWFSKKTTP